MKTTTLKPKNKSIPPKILLVEDDKLNQIIMGTFLERAGYSFDIAGNGMKALKMAEKVHYQLILMDIGLPDMSGIEVAICLRKKEAYATKVPIIALTALDGEEVKLKCRQAGMNGFANKPISQEKLCSLISQCIQGA